MSANTKQFLAASTEDKMDAIPKKIEASAIIDGKDTYLSALLFSDRLFITISQYATFGTLLTGSLTSHPDGGETCSVRTLLGAPAEESEAEAIELIASQLTRLSAVRYKRPLFLGCGLRGCTLDTARSAMGAIQGVLEQLEEQAIAAGQTQGSGGEALLAAR